MFHEKNPPKFFSCKQNGAGHESCTAMARLPINMLQTNALVCTPDRFSWTVLWHVWLFRCAHVPWRAIHNGYVKIGQVFIIRKLISFSMIITPYMFKIFLFYQYFGNLSIFWCVCAMEYGKSPCAQTQSEFQRRSRTRLKQWNLWWDYTVSVICVTF